MTTAPFIIVGGHEDKTGDRTILRAIAAAVRGQKLIIATIASHEPKGYFTGYQAAFADLGVGELVELYLDTRAESHDDRIGAMFAGAAGIFFTGGDQLRLSTTLGGTSVARLLRRRNAAGSVIAWPRCEQRLRR